MSWHIQRYILAAVILLVCAGVWFAIFRYPYYRIAYETCEQLGLQCEGRPRFSSLEGTKHGNRVAVSFDDSEITISHQKQIVGIFQPNEKKLSINPETAPARLSLGRVLNESKHIMQVLDLASCARLRRVYDLRGDGYFLHFLEYYLYDQYESHQNIARVNIDSVSGTLFLFELQVDMSCKQIGSSVGLRSYIPVEQASEQALHHIMSMDDLRTLAVRGALMSDAILDTDQNPVVWSVKYLLGLKGSQGVNDYRDCEDCMTITIDVSADAGEVLGVKYN
jgi:hypothetical protein